MISVVAPPQPGLMDTYSTGTEIPIQFPKPRRRYETRPITSCTLNSSSITGHAHLCFSDDGSWFEGHLVASSDESQYGLVGRCPEVSATELDTQCPSVTYEVSVIDHDSAETYMVGSVVLTSEEPGLCSLNSQSLRFTAQKSFHGQKADLLIQSYLTPRLVGKNLKVYFGQLSVDLIEMNVTTLRSPERRMWYM